MPGFSLANIAHLKVHTTFKGGKIAAGCALAMTEGEGGNDNRAGDYSWVFPPTSGQLTAAVFH